MSAQKEILEEQRKRVPHRRWSGGYPDYLADLHDNLIFPLHPDVRAAYDAGAGAEIPGHLDDQNQRWFRWHRDLQVPAKFQAIHSSSALVCNTFGYWYRQGDRTHLGKALGGNSSIDAMRFEHKMPTGLGGTPPHLDVSCLCGEMTSAVESKFSECYLEKKALKMGSRNYCPSVWREKGLAACGDLVDRINRSEMDGRFRFLDVAQLLKHLLGLTNHGGKFELVYLWFDMPGFREAEVHRDEIGLFEELVSREVQFRSLTYQQLFKNLLVHAGDQHEEYLQKLSERYF